MPVSLHMMTVKSRGQLEAHQHAVHGHLTCMEHDIECTTCTGVDNGVGVVRRRRVREHTLERIGQANTVLKTLKKLSCNI